MTLTLWTMWHQENGKTFCNVIDYAFHFELQSHFLCIISTNAIDIFSFKVFKLKLSIFKLYLMTQENVLWKNQPKIKMILKQRWNSSDCEWKHRYKCCLTRRQDSWHFHSNDENSVGIMRMFTWISFWKYLKLLCKLCAYEFWNIEISHLKLSSQICCSICLATICTINVGINTIFPLNLIIPKIQFYCCEMCI